MKQIILILAVVFLFGAWDRCGVVEAQPLAPGFKISTTGNRPPVPGCQHENLSLKEGETDAAMGGVRATSYILTNKSSSACTVAGYPSFQLLNRQGATIKRSTRQKSDETISLVAIEAGKTAWFNLNYNSGGAGHVGKPCPTYNKARIGIPGVARPFVLRTGIQTCPRTDFEVTSIQLGMPQ